MSVTPGEVIVGGVVLLMSQDPHLQLLAQENNQERFEEACHGPDWDTRVVRALVALKDALEVTP